MSEHYQPKQAGVRQRIPPSNSNGWKPRKTETLECPSGQEVQVRRPGPEFMLRAGKIARTFSKAEEAKTDDTLTPAEQGLEVIAKMSDEELAAVMIFARELVCAMLASPRLVRDPRPDFDEIGPDDIGDDFWFLFNYAMTGYFNLKVPIGKQEVEISDLESFRQGARLSGDSNHSTEVRTETEQSDGDPGLVASV